MPCTTKTSAVSAAEAGSAPNTVAATASEPAAVAAMRRLMDPPRTSGECCRGELPAPCRYWMHVPGVGFSLRRRNLAAEGAQLIRVEELHGDRRRRVTGEREGHLGDAAVRRILAGWHHREDLPVP